MDEMIARIDEIASGYEKQNVTSIGGSMGGYAALVLATRLRLGQALLFSPQTVLDHRLPNNPAAKINPTYPDPFILLRRSPETKFKVLLGSDELADIYNIFGFANLKNVQVEIICDGPHNLMNHVFQRGLLLEAIASFVEVRPPHYLLPTLDILSRPHIVNSIDSVVRAIYFDELEEAEFEKSMTYLESALDGWPVLQFYRGKFLAKLGRYDEALKFFSQSITQIAPNAVFYFDMGQVAIQAGEYQTAEEAFQKAVELAEAPSAPYLSKVGAAQMLQKRYDEAITTQYQALEIDPDYAGALYQLGLINNIIQNYESAIPYFERALEHGDTNPMTQKHLTTARNNLVTSV